MACGWHEISHEDPEEVTKFIEKLREKFEDEFGIVKVKRGKAHAHLGMTLDFTEPGKVKVDVSEMVKKMVEDFSVKSTKIDKTPAAEHSFVGP